jgi:hypothetical protein
MQPTDALWTEKWRHTPHPRIVEGRVPDIGSVGCDDEPLSSLWCACLAEAMGSHYREGMAVLDYGCGYGRFFNFLSGRLRTFRYYGLEVEGAPSGHGDACLAYLDRCFAADGRGRFSAVESALEREAIGTVNVVLLGSVFTHMDQEHLDRTFRKFLPVIERGGAVVFSAMIGARYETSGPGFLLDMGSAFFQQVTYTERQLADYFSAMSLRMVRAEIFHAPLERPPHHSTGGNMQTIYRVEAIAPESGDRGGA